MTTSSTAIKRNRSVRWLLWLPTLMLLAVTLSDCVYYNTFYNARKAFNEAEKARKGAGHRRRSGGSGGYRRAIEKSLKVIEDYPNSKYYDDALYVLTVSYFHTDQYSKSERRAREILANYPESEFARHARLYLAKAKLEQRAVADAMTIFQEMFEMDEYDKEFKAEAALALSSYHFDNRDYTSAEPYLLALRDSLGTAEERLVAQEYIADGLIDRFHNQEALGAYLQILGMEPTTDQRYRALLQAAVCSYRLQRIEDGQDYIRTLMEDELYFDSLGVLTLMMAEGYEYDEDIVQAEIAYFDIVDQEQNRAVRGQAFWNLGLIAQYDHDNLTDAKGYYDSASTLLGRTSEIGQMALQRSSDIGKLDTFKRTLTIDSTTTQSMIDEAAYTQYQLAELYWFQLNKPDSAIGEMQYVIDSFPSAFDAPKAMIAISQMIREHEQDTATADSILHEMLQKYATSDYVPEALDILGLRGSASDTGYAGLYFHRAEDFLIDEENIDSARTNYQVVVDRFPDSKYYLQSRFSLIWITETYESPGDSSVILAYTELKDSFPASPWAQKASKQLQYRPQRRGPADRERDSADVLADAEGDMQDGETEEDTVSYATLMEKVYIGPDGERLALHSERPIRQEEEFIYPTEAIRLAWEGDLYFQILLDFSGEVMDYVLMIRSESEEINAEAEKVVASMTFDVTEIPEELQGHWLVYKYTVRLPDGMQR